MTRLIAFFGKNWARDAGIFCALSGLFLLLEWRLFAAGSENQLFLYGDNLVTYNNLFYIFNNFNIKDIFGVFIGQNGMLGSYPLSEPQNSLWYLPITLLFAAYKIFRLDAIGLYYGLLFLHAFHFVIGSFFVYKTAQKIFGLDRYYSFLGALVYMGIGWNVAWFGTATLSYMIGILPIVFFVFFKFLKQSNLRNYCLFVLALVFLLYAGGIVNFFFYALLNLSLIYLILFFGKFDNIFLETSFFQAGKKFVLLFIVAPILGLLTYSIQLFQTYRVSQDIFHSNSAYDYLAFFGTHFYDLIGVILPKFAMLNFGSTTTPQIVWEFSLASILYVGIIPVIVWLLGFVSLKERMFYSLSFLAFFNLILSFGGAFFLYDATYFFPGNSMFRGHYKYLFLFGIYISLIVPYVLNRLSAADDLNSFRRVLRSGIGITGVLLFVGVLSSCAAFALKFLQKDAPELFEYYSLALTFSSYFFRAVFVLIASLVVLYVFMQHRKKVALLAIAFVLMLDTSINYKYSVLSKTNIESITSDSFFQCCKGKTIVNDIEKYSQLYFIPEILGVNPFFQYSAIPNRYLVEYQSHLSEGSGFSYPRLAAAGIDGVLTTRILDDPRFVLESEKIITRNNYKKLYFYNADGNIRNDWGEREGMIGQSIRYYGVSSEPQKMYFTTTYKEKTSEEGVWEYVRDKDFDSFVPALLVEKRRAPQEREKEKYVVAAHSQENRPSYKKVEMNTNGMDGVFFTNIPYAEFWKARVNGEERKIYRANGAFSGVKIKKEDGNAIIELYIDQTVSRILLGVSIVLFLLLCAGGIFSESSLVKHRDKLLRYVSKLNLFRSAKQ